MNTLTILYTQNIGGDLALLPRLYRFLQSLKAEYDPQALLIDLGNSCAPDVWHCEASKGRSTLMVLDAMGYHAANAMALDDEAREILKSNSSMGLVTSQQSWRLYAPPSEDGSILIAGEESPALTLCIVAVAAPTNRLENRMLHLQAVDKGAVGMVKLALDSLSIIAEGVFVMPSGLLPEATIAAAVEFVEEEANYVRHKRDKT